MRDSTSAGYPDCFSRTELGRCRQLELTRCAGDECPFMKTTADRQSQELRVYQRLASLDEETQEHISRKYYHGTRPWQMRDKGETRRRRKRKGLEK